MITTKSLKIEIIIMRHKKTRKVRIIIIFIYLFILYIIILHDTACKGTSIA